MAEALQVTGVSTALIFSAIPNIMHAPLVTSKPNGWMNHAGAQGAFYGLLVSRTELQLERSIYWNPESNLILSSCDLSVSALICSKRAGKMC